MNAPRAVVPAARSAWMNWVWAIVASATAVTDNLARALLPLVYVHDEVAPVFAAVVLRTTPMSADAAEDVSSWQAGGAVATGTLGAMVTERTPPATPVVDAVDPADPAVEEVTLPNACVTAEPTCAAEGVLVVFVKEVDFEGPLHAASNRATAMRHRLLRVHGGRYAWWSFRVAGPAPTDLSLGPSDEGGAAAMSFLPIGGKAGELEHRRRGGSAAVVPRLARQDVMLRSAMEPPGVRLP